MASEQEIIHTIKNATSLDTKIRIIDQLGHKIKPHHRELIRFLVELSRQESEPTLSYSAKRSLYQVRTRYNITNFPLFLMDPVSLLQSDDPAYRIKALEIFDKKGFSPEQGYFLLGSIYYEQDPFVLSRMVKILPRLTRDLPPQRIEKILAEFTTSTDSRVRANALESMKELSGEQESLHLDILWQHLGDPHERVRNNCINQLLETRPPNLKPRIEELLQKSENLHELNACLKIADETGFCTAESIKKATEKLSRLEKEQKKNLAEKQTAELTETVEISEPVSSQVSRRFHKLRILTHLPGWLLSGTICLLLIFLYLSGKTSANKWQKLYEESKVRIQELQKQQEKELKEIKEKNRSDILIAQREIPLTEKTELFNEHGELLKQNSQLFLQQAEELFEKENYDAAIEVYKVLYNVYKDNRLAVDAVRQLSRAQKVQNVLYSVNDHIEKQQWISAQKRIEEIKHLISPDNYEKHLKRIEEKKGENK